MPYKFEYTPLPPLVKGDKLQDGIYEIVSDTEDVGGFGRIYKARVLKGGRNMYMDVALKEFHVQDILDELSQTSIYDSAFSSIDLNQTVEILKDNFVREANIMYWLKRQKDNHVPQLFEGLKQSQGRLYYTMSFIDGPTMTELVNEKGPLDEITAVSYVVQIAKVLHKTHEWKLIHCDISPNNIMLQRDFAILVDFGNAYGYREVLRTFYSQEELALMQKDGGDMAYLNGKIMQLDTHQEIPKAGTPGFTAPRDFIGKPQCDIYGLGATLFFMLTGKKPSQLLSDIAKKKNEETLHAHGVSTECVETIMHAMNMNIEECTQSAKEFLQDLPKDIVFDVLLNYKDYDYNRR